MAEQAVERYEGGQVAQRRERDHLTPAQVVEQSKQIQELMKLHLKPGVHYGIIPGTEKPTILKAGSEQLGFMFRLRPDYAILPQSVIQEDFIAYRIRCDLIHIPTGEIWGQGFGACNSREDRFAWVAARRKCPKCEKETIIKGKEEYGGGWLCHKKRGGCGAKFEDGDETIESQSADRVARENIAELDNALLKQACIRSRKEATLSATAASDTFTQDLDEMGIGMGGGGHKPRPVTFPFPDEVKGKEPKDCDLATLRKYLPTFEKAANDPKNKYQGANQKLVAAIKEAIAEKTAKVESPAEQTQGSQTQDTPGPSAPDASAGDAPTEREQLLARMRELGESRNIPASRAVAWARKNHKVGVEELDVFQLRALTAYLSTQ